MIKSLFIILLCQLAGETISHYANIPAPGPVIGMVILLIGLIIKGSIPSHLDHTANKFIEYLGLLYIPAGAGVSLYLGLIAQQWVVIIIASMTGTILTLILSAYLFQWLADRNNKE